MMLDMIFVTVPGHANLQKALLSFLESNARYERK